MNIEHPTVKNKIFYLHNMTWICIRVEPDIGYSIVPDIRPDTSNNRPLKRKYLKTNQNLYSNLKKNRYPVSGTESTIRPNPNIYIFCRSNAQCYPSFSENHRHSSQSRTISRALFGFFLLSFFILLLLYLLLSSPCI